MAVGHGSQLPREITHSFAEPRNNIRMYLSPLHLFPVSVKMIDACKMSI